MLNAKDKKMLRKEAQSYRSLFQIGKDGIQDNLVNTLEDSLTAHELVKLNLLKTAPITTKEAAEILANETGSEIVHIVGHTFVLYRRSKKNLMGL
ncbi:YhbY family RNA-binding protein [Merdibacter massiliensis]|uniref:YhbY family RNA-binding protein n=1 Tax=Merdibacter massiliensis TaxID=1871030 RepID=UPI00096AA6FE|nr:YhbY family RNA-binding protein [Merdibacter massiliensis]